MITKVRDDLCVDVYILQLVVYLLLLVIFINLKRSSRAFVREIQGVGADQPR